MRGLLRATIMRGTSLRRAALSPTLLIGVGVPLHCLTLFKRRGHAGHVGNSLYAPGDGWPTVRAGSWMCASRPRHLSGPRVLHTRHSTQTSGYVRVDVRVEAGERAYTRRGLVRLGAYNAWCGASGVYDTT